MVRVSGEPAAGEGRQGSGGTVSQDLPLVNPAQPQTAVHVSATFTVEMSCFPSETTVPSSAVPSTRRSTTSWRRL